MSVSQGVSELHSRLATVTTLETFYVRSISILYCRSWLSAQEKRPTTVVSSSSQTVAPPPSASKSRRLVVGLLALVAVLLGTNAYTYSESRAWKVHRIAMLCAVRGWYLVCVYSGT